MNGSFGKTGAPWCWVKNSTGAGHIEQMIWYCLSEVLLFLNMNCHFGYYCCARLSPLLTGYKRSDLAQQQLISPVTMLLLMITCYAYTIV